MRTRTRENNLNLIAETLAHTHECRLEEREASRREQKMRLGESRRKWRQIVKRAKESYIVQVV